MRIGVPAAAKIVPMTLVRPGRGVDGVEVTAIAARDARRARRFVAEKARATGLADAVHDHKPFPTTVDDAVADMRALEAHHPAAGLPRREPV